MFEMGTLASLTTVLLFIFSCFQYVVIRPLGKAIDNLQKAITELRAENNEKLSRIHSLEIRLSILEQSANRLANDIDLIRNRT